MVWAFGLGWGGAAVLAFYLFSMLMTVEAAYTENEKAAAAGNLGFVQTVSTEVGTVMGLLAASLYIWDASWDAFMYGQKEQVEKASESESLFATTF